MNDNSDAWERSREACHC